MPIWGSRQPQHTAPGSGAPDGEAESGPEAAAGPGGPPFRVRSPSSGVLLRGGRLRAPCRRSAPSSLTMARPGCPGRGDQGSSGGGGSCSSSSSTARPRLHTHRPQRAPPPAPTVPQRPPRAPRLARPRPARPTCGRTATPADPSAPRPAPPRAAGPRASPASAPHRPGFATSRARARAHPPGDYFPSPRAPPPVPLPTPSRRKGTVGCALGVPVRAAPLLGPGHGGNESLAAIGPTFPAMRQTGKSHCVVAGGGWNLQSVAAWSE